MVSNVIITRNRYKWWEDGMKKEWCDVNLEIVKSSSEIVKSPDTIKINTSDSQYFS